MAKQTPAPSQENLPIADSPTSAPKLPDSPSLPTYSLPSGSKPRKPPTITPRSFSRFFTPKSSVERNGKISASRRALRDITTSASNHGRGRFAKGANKLDEQEAAASTHAVKRRRRIESSPDRSLDLSSPLKRIRNQSLELSEDDGADAGESSGESDAGKRPKGRRRKLTPKAISRSRCIRGPGHNLQQELYSHPWMSKDLHSRSNEAYSVGWQYETTRFSTLPQDTFISFNLAAPSNHTLSFCTASCNRNTLLAIGDEDGGIRLLESAMEEKPAFSQAYLSFRPHTNAILDLAFSPDDMLLATASGDQTSQVIDMLSQRAIYTMAGHVSSVKQVCFQPGSSSIIASSSRDGSVQIWDLRCKGLDAPVRDIKVSLDPDATRAPQHRKMIWARSVNSIFEAHIHRQSPVSTVSPANITKTLSSFDAPSKTESPGRRGDVSITALAFLQPGREHLLITASEADASVKLWDIRSTHNHRRNRASPLSSTRQPESHNKYRPFGLTSLSLGTESDRLYALCRDNTVYVYSTSHLILGHAPELSSATASRPRRSGGPEREGLGPLYGLRHPSFHATTFYIKSALRTANGDQSQLLAVGSSDGTPILFPTNERHLSKHTYPELPNSVSQHPRPSSHPALKRVDSATGFSGRLDDTLPIYQHGTALVRGHSREVTGLTWTKRGELITLSDDFTVRCWRESDQARELRMGGEAEGRRWGCGWAEATDGWDEENE